MVSPITPPDGAQSDDAAERPKCGLWGCGRKATTTAAIVCAGMESRDIVICPYHAQMFLSADKEPRP